MNSKLNNNYIFKKKIFFIILLIIVFGISLFGIFNISSNFHNNNNNNFYISSFLFIRTLGFLYLISSISNIIQVKGLIGENGILPIKVNYFFYT